MIEIIKHMRSLEDALNLIDLLMQKSVSLKVLRRSFFANKSLVATNLISCHCHSVV